MAAEGAILTADGMIIGAVDVPATPGADPQPQPPEARADGMTKIFERVRKPVVGPEAGLPVAIDRQSPVDDARPVFAHVATPGRPVFAPADAKAMVGKHQATPGR